MTVKDLLDKCGEDFGAEILVIPNHDSEAQFTFHRVKFLEVGEGQVLLQMAEVSE